MILTLTMIFWAFDNNRWLLLKCPSDFYWHIREFTPSQKKTYFFLVDLVEKVPERERERDTTNPRAMVNPVQRINISEMSFFHASWYQQETITNHSLGIFKLISNRQNVYLRDLKPPKHAFWDSIVQHLWNKSQLSVFQMLVSKIPSCVL